MYLPPSRDSTPPDERRSLRELWQSKGTKPIQDHQVVQAKQAHALFEEAMSSDIITIIPQEIIFST
jgi:hypothetical protein